MRPQPYQIHETERLSMNQTISIRSGRPDDETFAHRMFELARQSLRSSGIDQWQGDYPCGDDFAADVLHSRGLVIELDGVPIGVAAAYIGHEPTYDAIAGQWLSDETQYGVIHRIAIDPSAKRSGAATAVIDHLQRQCMRSGIRSMRCDTHAQNLAMRRTLEKNGYRICGTICVEDGTGRVAYEKLL